MVPLPARPGATRVVGDMAPGESGAPSRRDALDAAGRALRAAQLADRDEIRAALGVLRQASRVHETAVREARLRLDDARRGRPQGMPDGGPAVEEAERALAEALAAKRGVDEARPLLHRLSELTAEGEAVLDMAGGISAGHEGVVVAAEHRLLFLSLRRTVVHPYTEVRDASAKGRWLGARLVVATASGPLVVSGIAPRRAGELAALVRERLGAQAPAAG